MLSNILATENGGGRRIIHRDRMKEFINSEQEPLAADSKGVFTPPEEENTTYSLSSLGTQFVLRDLQSVGTSTIGFLLNTVKFVAKLPAKAAGVDPKYTSGILEDGKGIFLELG